MSEKLLNCPFCGEVAEIEEIKQGGAVKDGVMFAAGCCNSECIVYQTHDEYSRRTDAAKAWNTRADSSAELLNGIELAVRALDSESYISIDQESAVIALQALLAKHGRGGK